MNLIRFVRPIVKVSLAVVFVTAIGCGGPTTCTVTGKLTTKGKPVYQGVINLLGSDGVVVSGGIDDDGAYTVINAPVGVVKVSVVSDRPATQLPFAVKYDPDRPAPPAPPPNPGLAKWMPIDAKYADVATSGKTMTLKPGTNVVDIELE